MRIKTHSLVNFKFSIEQIFEIQKLPYIFAARNPNNISYLQLSCIDINPCKDSQSRYIPVKKLNEKCK